MEAPFLLGDKDGVLCIMIRNQNVLCHMKRYFLNENPVEDGLYLIEGTPESFLPGKGKSFLSFSEAISILNELLNQEIEGDERENPKLYRNLLNLLKKVCALVLYTKPILPQKTKNPLDSALKHLQDAWDLSYDLKFRIFWYKEKFTGPKCLYYNGEIILCPSVNERLSTDSYEEGLKIIDEIMVREEISDDDHQRILEELRLANSADLHYKKSDLN